ncbi:MAG: OmpA family protein, partial [Bacteroidaceae bacterium]|nr:OmpA family protein [Bacteroidaceae bacterium]
MKKFFMLFVMGAAVLTASAQHSVTNHKFFDNWSIGLVGGGVNPTKGNFFDDTRAVGGLEVTKQITPVFGLAFQGVSGFNTTGANTVVDNVNASVLGNVNFSNWFCGYKGKPRLFEVEGVVGVGFNHYFGDNDRFTAVDPALCSGNTFTGKLGLNLNFNLGKKKAWTVGLKPAIVYDLEGARGDANTHAQFNINHSVIELMAGVTYHFKTS